MELTKQKPRLILIRGLPGSGKTTLANALTGYTLVEADMFFTKNGQFVFRPDLLEESHVWCQRETTRLLEEGKNVVVANTFVKVWEMRYYLNMADEMFYDIEIQVASGNFKSIHGVPESTIKKMRRNWENYTL